MGVPEEEEKTCELADGADRTWSAEEVEIREEETLKCLFNVQGVEVSCMCCM